MARITLASGDIIEVEGSAGEVVSSLSAGAITRIGAVYVNPVHVAVVSDEDETQGSEIDF